MTILNYLFLIICIPQLTFGRGLEDILTKQSSLDWFLVNGTTHLNSTNPYCSICCVDIKQAYKGRKCGIHTMCAYESRPIGPACVGLILMEFYKNEIDAIVDAHNTLRNKIAMGWEDEGDPGPQPQAANMRLLSWDEELATVAMRWATQCVYFKDECRDLRRFPVGQNLGKGTYASTSDLQHIDKWYRLVQFSNKDIIEHFNIQTDPDLAQFTQLIWADTYLVGCARVSFQTSDDGDTMYQEHFVCNYGPSGNIPNQPVYKIGETCSACPEGTYCTNPEYQGLCGNGVPDNETLALRRKKKHQKEMEDNSANWSQGFGLVAYFVSFYIMFM